MTRCYKNPHLPYLPYQSFVRLMGQVGVEPIGLHMTNIEVAGRILLQFCKAVYKYVMEVSF